MRSPTAVSSPRKPSEPSLSASEACSLHLGISELEWARAEQAGLESFDALIHSEERFRVIFEYAPDAYYLTDLKGVFLEGNLAAERLTGYDREEIIGKSFLALSLLSRPQMPRGAGLLVKNALGKPTGPDEFVLTRKDGTQVPVEISTHPVRLNNKAVILGIARDISERKKAEQERDKLATVVRNSSELINLARPDGTMAFMNEAGCNILGLDPADVEKTTILQVIPEHLHALAREVILPSLLKKGAWKGDLQYRNFKTGRLIDVQATTFTIKDAKTGRPLYLANVSVDITERKKAEGAVRGSEERFRSIFEEAPIGMLMADAKSRIFRANASFCRMLGYAEQEIVGLTFKDITHPDQIPLDAENIGKLSAGEIPFYRTEKRYVRKDGGILWGRLTLNMISGEEGEGPCFLAMIEDITERKQAADALQQSERKYRELADSLPSPVFETDLKGRLTFANRTAHEWFGYSKADMDSGLDVLNMLAEPDRDRAESSFQRVLGLGESSSGEYRVRRKDGSAFPALIVARSLAEAGRPAGLQGIVIDISHRKLAETALRESEATLQAFINALPDPAFLLDRNHVALVVNKAFAERFGKSGPDIVGKVIYGLLPPELAALRRSQIDRAFRTRDSVVFEDVRADKSYINYVYPIFEIGGEAARVAVFALDISQRKTAETELNKTTAMLRETLGNLINVVATTVEVRDPYTAGHQKRVSNLARAIATEMGLSKDQIEGIRVAGVIHDIGKISIPSEILSKPGKLSGIEMDLIRTHSQVGYKILKNIKFPWPIAQIVYQHHERMNGTGYPRHIKGEGILLEARILAVADVMEAMSSHRPYRSALGVMKALEEIDANRGRFYDPGVVDACVKLFTEQRFRFEG